MECVREADFQAHEKELNPGSPRHLYTCDGSDSSLQTFRRPHFSACWQGSPHILHFPALTALWSLVLGAGEWLSTGKTEEPFHLRPWLISVCPEAHLLCGLHGVPTVICDPLCSASAAFLICSDEGSWGPYRHFGELNYLVEPDIYMPSGTGKWFF